MEKCVCHSLHVQANLKMADATMFFENRNVFVGAITYFENLNLCRTYSVKEYYFADGTVIVIKVIRAFVGRA